MELGQLELVQLLEVWSGGLLMLMWLRRERVGLMIDLYLVNGSFQNVLGETTWIEAWQGGSDACGAPVAPHDGSASATFSYDEASATLILTGKELI